MVTYIGLLKGLTPDSLQANKSFTKANWESRSNTSPVFTDKDFANVFEQYIGLRKTIDHKILLNSPDIN